MLGLPSFLYSPAMLKKIQASEAARAKAEAARRIPLAEPWTPDIKWARELNIQAKTWPKFSLFDVPPCKWSHPEGRRDGTFLLSPQKKWMYSEVIFPKGMTMGNLNIAKMKRGSVLFDDDILVPRVHRYVDALDRWDENPFMSITPQELMTLRNGTRRAKGRTFVVGLGLGYQLIEVSKSKKVKELILIEKSQDIVDWLLPKIQPMLARKLDDVIIGDAYKLMPKMHGDVALVDIYDSINGSWEREMMELAVKEGKVKSCWNWGTKQERDPS